jgi:hypothetical protein
MNFYLHSSENPGTHSVPCVHSNRRRERRGVAIIVVLAIVAIALASAYSLLRSQATVVQVQANTNQRSQARQAAVTGLLVAMQKMSATGWLGVGTTMTGSLSSQDRYSVTYTAGDPTIPVTDPNQPFRVTLVSTGTSANALQSGQLASYRIRAVMHLVAKQLGAEPTNWSTMLQYTFYQNGSGNLVLNSPCQVQGSLRVQGSVRLGKDYNWSTSAQSRYLGDLGTMQLMHVADDRPLTGKITLPTSSTDATTLGFLQTQLGLTLINSSSSSSNSIPLPTALSNYQIYPGGPVYKVGAVASTLSGMSLSPDPVNNPLGIFFNSSDITLGNNISLTGTLMSGGTVNVTGTGVNLLPFNMPSLAGSSTPIRLPTIVAGNSLHCASGVSASITGVVIAGGSVTVDQGSQTNSLAMLGHVIAGGDFTIHGRSEWQLTSALWSSLYSAYITQLALPTKVLYFPVYLSAYGQNPNPLLTLKADTTLLLNHWQDLSGPIVVPATGDGGLRWELLSWTDNI